MYKYLFDTDILLYDLLNILSGVAVYIFNFFQYKKQKSIQSFGTRYIQNAVANKFPNSKVKIFSGCVFWIILELIIFSFVECQLTASFNRTFGDLVKTGANYFGQLYHIPFLLAAFCILLWCNPIKQIDLITPSFPLALFIAQIACFCHGCCRGIEWENGLFNYESNLYEVPLQLIEAGLALLIFIFLMFWRKKAKPGTMFPTYLIIYSATRFCSEFLSAKGNVFWIFKTYHILCLIGIVFGVVELIVALKFGDQISELFENSHYFIPNNSKKKKKKKKK